MKGENKEFSMSNFIPSILFGAVGTVVRSLYKTIKGKLSWDIEKLELEDNVILLGQRENVPEILSKAKLFVLSSDYEGMPNALMEAMAVGVPAVSTDCPCGGPKELFGEKLQNLLTPVGNTDALADKMIFLLQNDKERENIGKELRQRAKLFRVDDVGQKWIEYIESLL